MKRALLAALAILPGRALADDAQYAPYPLGGRAVGLGGAFAAIADDPSGMHYNPAGLVDVGRSSLQVSTNLYGFDLDVSEGLVSNASKSALAFDTLVAELQIIPTSAGGVVGLGARDEDGAYRHAYALGVFVPSARTVNLQTSETSGGIQDAFRRNLQDRTIVGTAAYAYRLDEIWRVGVTAAVGLRTLHVQEETSRQTPTGRFETAATGLDIAVGTLALTFGLKAVLPRDWSIGVAVTTPSSRVFDAASVRVVRSSADPDAPSSRFSLTDEGGLRADTRTGAVIRAGLAREWPDWSLLSLDLSFIAPSRYALVGLPSSSRLADALTLAIDVERTWVVNVSAGYECSFSSDYALSFGAFTDLPSSPAIEQELYDRDRLPHVTSLGATVAIGLIGDHTETHFGLLASYGWGRDVIARNDALAALGEAAYRAVQVEQLRVFLSISSTFKY